MLQSGSKCYSVTLVAPAGYERFKIEAERWNPNQIVGFADVYIYVY